MHLIAPIYVNASRYARPCAWCSAVEGVFGDEESAGFPTFGLRVSQKKILPATRR